MTPPQIDKKDRQEFYRSLLSLQSAIETMKKDKGNPFFKSKYVPLPTMLKILKPVLNQHGFVLSQPVVPLNTQQGVINSVESIIVHAETGISEKSQAAITVDVPDIQKLCGSVTFLRRYTLSSLLALEEEDDDGNLASGKVKRGKVKSQDVF